ncbi:MAG: winged helix-turn-helix domain-containing protein [Planctomycetota bacterium]
MATVDNSSLVDQIGETAGAVWHTLLEHGQLTITQLAKEVDAPRDRVMQALGWLAREDKIRVEETSRRKVISLS